MRSYRRGLLALLTLAAGCPGPEAAYPYTCAEKEYLVSQGASWRCAPLPDLPFAVPRCQIQQVLTASSAGRLACTDYTIGQLDLAEIERGVNDLETRLAGSIRNLPRHFVGVTAARSTGLFSFPGKAPGLIAAAARCAAEFAGAQLCTLPDLYDSVADGALGANQTIAKSWVLAPGWNTPLAGAQNPRDGLADNCAGYTYGADDKGWAGQAVEWTLLSTGAPGFKLHGGASAPCSASLPLACCAAVQP